MNLNTDIEKKIDKALSLIILFVIFKIILFFLGIKTFGAFYAYFFGGNFSMTEFGKLLMDIITNSRFLPIIFFLVFLKMFVLRFFSLKKQEQIKKNNSSGINDIELKKIKYEIVFFYIISAVAVLLFVFLVYNVDVWTLK